MFRIRLAIKFKFISIEPLTFKKFEYVKNLRDIKLNVQNLLYK